MAQVSLIGLYRLRDALKVQIDYWREHGPIREEDDAKARHLTLAELEANLAATEEQIALRELRKA